MADPIEAELAALRFFALNGTRDEQNGDIRQLANPILDPLPGVSQPWLGLALVAGGMRTRGMGAGLRWCSAR